MPVERKRKARFIKFAKVYRGVKEMIIKYDGGSYTCDAKELFNLLLESSSLRDDIKSEVGGGY